jgi:hypothetical protein
MVMTVAEPIPRRCFWLGAGAAAVGDTGVGCALGTGLALTGADTCPEAAPRSQWLAVSLEHNQNFLAGSSQTKFGSASSISYNADGELNSTLLYHVAEGWNPRDSAAESFHAAYLKGFFVSIPIIGDPSALK